MRYNRPSKAMQVLLNRQSSRLIAGYQHLDPTITQCVFGNQQQKCTSIFLGAIHIQLCRWPSRPTASCQHLARIRQWGSRAQQQAGSSKLLKEIQIGCGQLPSRSIIEYQCPVLKIRLCDSRIQQPAHFSRVSKAIQIQFGRQPFRPMAGFLLLAVRIIQWGSRTRNRRTPIDMGF